MILKKPYAFMIKHFKLIHLIMCALSVYIAYKCNDMLYYFTQYINAGYYIKINDVVGDYINIYFYVSLGIVLLLNISLLILLHVKEKQNKIYGILFIVYIVVTALVINGHFNLLNMQLEVIDFRKVRLFRDMLFVSIFVQYASIIFMLIRGLGFNVKKFNFDQEIEELQISSSDNAEFEFTVELDTNTFTRKLRAKKRHLRYFFIEHKSLFFIIGTLVIVLSSVIAFIGIGTSNFNYKENTAVKINNNTIVINNSYITTTNYKGQPINNNKFVIVNFNIKNTSEQSNSLDLTKFGLLLNNTLYKPIKTNEDDFFDFGEYYKGTKLKQGEVKNYILVFELPKEENISKVIFRYSALQTKKDNIVNKNFDIKLDPITNWIEQIIDEKTLTEQVNFNNTILKNTSMIINSYEISNSFDIIKEYCIDNMCDTFKTTIAPENIKENIRAVLKLDMNVIYDNNITSSKIRDKSNLITKLCKLSYNIEDKNYIDNTIINLTKEDIVSENEIYLDVDSKIKSATNIKLIMTIRGSEYIYNIN